MARKILIMESAFKQLHAEIDALAKQHGLETVFCAPQTQEELMKLVSNNDVEIIVNTWPESRVFGGYTPEMIRAIGKSGVRGICHQGAGYDMVGDIDVWKHDTDVQVSNCPNAPATDTADTAMFLLLGTMRNFRPFNLSLHKGNWRGGLGAGKSPQGCILGILGMGNIGRLIRDRARPFGYDHILYHQRRKLDADLELGAKFEPSLDAFLSKCDAIVLAAPHNKATHHILSRDRLFNIVKPGAVIINIGRGPLIDEVALSDALAEGRLAAAGLDVFEHEPKITPKLLENERSIFLPHVGTHTTHAWLAFEQEIYDNIKSFLETGRLISIVPELRS